MTDKNDPKNEGHTREWQDRARVVLDAKRDAGAEADPNQSPAQPLKDDAHTTTDKSKTDGNEKNKDDSFY